MASEHPTTNNQQLTTHLPPDACAFEIVTIDGRTNYNPSNGTVARGVGRCPRCAGVVSGDYIKTEAQAGRMGQQLCALAVKNTEGRGFREPRPEDVNAAERAAEALTASLPRLLAEDLVPTEEYPEVSSDPRPRFYGMPLWRDMFSPRQLLGHAIYLEEIRRVKAEIFAELPREKAEAIAVYLALIFDKCCAYNCRTSRWHAARQVLAPQFERHDFSFKWSFAEFDAAHMLWPWALDQIADAYLGIAALTHKPATLFAERQRSATSDPPASGHWSLATGHCPVSVSLADAAEYRELPDGSVHLICVDPPYYENVMYAELSDFFYVWQKRTLGDLFPQWFSSELAEKEREAVANPARFRGLARRARDLAEHDYEAKMRASFTRMRELLRPEGVLTVMFNHKKVEAWDTLASALIGAGFEITASWPIRTESEHSLHQARKNAANSTILLVCRKRHAGGEGGWWEDALPRVRETVRERLERFEELGITGVDLMLSTFGPALQVISSRWPVRLRSGEEVRPEVALDEARRVVTEYRMEKLLREHRQAGLDPPTLWTILAWDIYRAETFPFGEAHKLAIATGVDLDQQIFRRHLAAKSGSNVQLLEPALRQRRSQVNPEADEFSTLIDAIHTAMLVWQEDGAAGCRRLFDRTGLSRREEFVAGVQGLLRALPQLRRAKPSDPPTQFETLSAIAQQFLTGRVEVPQQPKLFGGEDSEAAEEDETEE
jgi:adenine-specific DNA methylase